MNDGKVVWVNEYNFNLMRNVIILMFVAMCNQLKDSVRMLCVVEADAVFKTL